MKFRFHLLGLPHTVVNHEYNACAYTQKVLKFMDMMAPRGHEIVLYANEGSYVPPGVEFVQVLSEKERQQWFGEHNKGALYDLKWEASEPYWDLFNRRAGAGIILRAQTRDFILTPAGRNCHQPIGDMFPGSYSDIATKVMLVEFGIGYYGTFSKYRVFESHGHREWIHGRADNTVVDYFDTVIPNYFDPVDFCFGKQTSEDPRLQAVLQEPYYLFMGRFIESKGWMTAVQATETIGAKLLMAGQGDFKNEWTHVLNWSHATVEERAKLMANAIACFAPTRYREPFGGVAVESQICGTPCITTDYGAFVETVEPRWRCASHREFCEVAKSAQELAEKDRQRIRDRALQLYSLDAVAPMYERYFRRLYALWGNGWYEMRDLESI
jgi:glycosyltransferase involved in cell wall biosynthesis